MISARYETYPTSIDQLPFILHTGLERTSLLFSKEQNWHDNLEFQLCTAGSGTVLLNGVPHPFFPDDVISVESNMIINLPLYPGSGIPVLPNCFMN